MVMYPELTPKLNTAETARSLMWNIVLVEQYRNKVRNSETSGKRQMWPLWLEDIFFDALLLIPPIGQTRINTGIQPPIMNGRNTLIAKYLSMHGWTPTPPRNTRPIWRTRDKRDSERAPNSRLPDKQPNYDYFSKLLNANEDVFLRPSRFQMFISVSYDQSLVETADSCPNFGDDNKKNEEVLHAGNSPLRILHEYSGGLSQAESSSVSAISRKWAKHFPKLREKLITAHNDTQSSDTETSRCVVGPCDTLHLIVTLDLETGSQCLEMSELNCIVELSIDRSALYNHSWRTVTSVMKPDELYLSGSEPEVWDLNEPAEAHHAGCSSNGSCRCTHHSIRIPFPVGTWAAILMKLVPYMAPDPDHERDSLGGRPYRRRPAQGRKIENGSGFGKPGGTRTAAELLSEVAMYQEIWSAPNADSCVPNVVSRRSWTRRAVILWTFSPAQKRRDGSPERPGTIWRFLTKLDPFSQYHQQHAYVNKPPTPSPDTSMSLGRNMSHGYTALDGSLSGTSVAARAPYEWPLVSSCSLTDRLSTAPQYNSYIGSFHHLNAVSNSSTGNFFEQQPVSCI
ncbi:hypothetical protein NPX13_g11023 [Xylaria arbuscula]|uniref:TEA domain-containing protein n=1 Tax=Xylaria arbuscula TaxID=114810 RepID=A0A9W8N3G5_9PEZI|nr:hypothetical protein NPX13_g11023 [Xylaria arbuscula]